MMFKLSMLLLATTLLGGCNYIDDYAFGKDNTPQPAMLGQLTSNKTVNIDYSVAIGKFKSSWSTPDLQPTISGNTVYVANSVGKIFAINKNTGTVLWQKDLRHDLIAGPVVAAKYLILSTDDSAIYLVSRADGTLLQRISVANDVLAKPLVHAGKIYLKTISGQVYCIDLKTGKKDWKYTHGAAEIILKASSSPVYYNNMILVGFSDGSLVGLDPYKGHLIFQQHISFSRGVSEVERLNDIDTKPLLDNDKLYIASYQGEIGAYQVSESQFLWKKPASTFHDLAFINDSLIMVSSNDVIWSFQKTLGQVLWKQQGLRARHLTAPLIWQGKIWVADSLGYLHGIAPQTGKFISRLKLPQGVLSTPVSDGKYCWVITTNGQLHRLSLEK